MVPAEPRTSRKRHLPADRLARISATHGLAAAAPVLAACSAIAEPTDPRPPPPARPPTGRARRPVRRRHPPAPRRRASRRSSTHGRRRTASPSRRSDPGRSGAPVAEGEHLVGPVEVERLAPAAAVKHHELVAGTGTYPGVRIPPSPFVRRACALASIVLCIAALSAPPVVAGPADEHWVEPISVRGEAHPTAAMRTAKLAGFRDLGPLLDFRQATSSYTVVVRDVDDDGWDDLFIDHHGHLAELFMNGHEGEVSTGFSSVATFFDSIHRRRRPSRMHDRRRGPRRARRRVLRQGRPLGHRQEVERALDAGTRATNGPTRPRTTGWRIGGAAGASRRSWT
jgi:hypothetical protein